MSRCELLAWHCKPRQRWLASPTAQHHTAVSIALWPEPSLRHKLLQPFACSARQPAVGPDCAACAALCCHRLCQRCVAA